MKTITIILVFAVLLPQAGIAGKKINSYEFAGIDWGTSLGEAVDILEGKGYTVDPGEPTEEGQEITRTDPDAPRYVLKNDFLNNHPGTVELYGNANDGLWKVRILFISHSDLRDSIIDGIFVKKYGRPNERPSDTEFASSSGYEGKWNKAADKSEISIDCSWTKVNETKEQHLQIIYQKPNLVKREKSVIDF